MKYPFTFYVDTLPKDVGGCANGFVIRILKKYKNRDEGIYQHELLHVKQWAIPFIIGILLSTFLFGGSIWWTLPAVIGMAVHPVLYLLIDEYKLFTEVEAYKVQAKYYPDDRIPLFASFISGYYKLDITTENALKLLRE